MSESLCPESYMEERLQYKALTAWCSGSLRLESRTLKSALHSEGLRTGQASSQVSELLMALTVQGRLSASTGRRQPELQQSPAPTPTHQADLC